MKGSRETNTSKSRFSLISNHCANFVLVPSNKRIAGQPADQRGCACGLPCPCTHRKLDVRYTRALFKPKYKRQEGSFMTKVTHEITPFDGQKPGTSGLRKKTRAFHGGRIIWSVSSQSTFQRPSAAARGQVLCGGRGRAILQRVRPSRPSCAWPAAQWGCACDRRAGRPAVDACRLAS